MNEWMNEWMNKWFCRNTILCQGTTWAKEMNSKLVNNYDISEEHEKYLKYLHYSFCHHFCGGILKFLYDTNDKKTHFKSTLHPVHNQNIKLQYVQVQQFHQHMVITVVISPWPVLLTILPTVISRKYDFNCPPKWRDTGTGSQDIYYHIQRTRPLTWGQQLSLYNISCYSWNLSGQIQIHPNKGDKGTSWLAL